jgi:hypothetical protein
MIMKSSLFSLLLALGATTCAQAGVVVIGNLARSADVSPGEDFQGLILLRNPDNQPADVRVFQTDYLSQADGSNAFGEPGTTPRSNADWLTVTPSRLKLAPGETQTIRYRGTAPADKSLRGTYWSMIMVEPNTAPAITPDGKVGQVSVGLQTTVRFGIQIVTEIGKDIPGSLKILDRRLTRDETGRHLQFDIGNDGERLLIPTTTVELFDSQGVSVGRFDAGRARVYPSCSVRAKVDLSKLPVGKYAAMVVLDSGEAEVMGAQYDLEITPEFKQPEGAVLANRNNQ